MKVALRILCGLVALGLSVLLLQTSAAQSRPAACTKTLVEVGPVFGGGCWHRVGTKWVSRTPVTLDGLKLVGPGTVAADEGHGTITSSKTVRWLLGPIQIRRAPFKWKAKKPLQFRAKGTVRGLSYGGTAHVAFTDADGGTAIFAAKFKIPQLKGVSVTGDGVLEVSRRHTFNVHKVHVGVTNFTLDRLLFKKLDFQYGDGVWSADASVTLPAFAPTLSTLDGHIEIANGKPRDIAVAGSGLSVPLGEGLFLTKLGFDVGLSPITITGSATAVYGPPIAGHGPLELNGSLTYSTGNGPRWTADGQVVLPLPGVSTPADVTLFLYPGRAIEFGGALDLTFHGFGLSAQLRGFAATKAFNVEGDSSLQAFGFGLSGKALVSSKGMSACGKISLLFLSKKLGFGYQWGGTVHVVGSSCDVGKFRVALSERSSQLVASAPIPVVASSPAGFAVFAAQGGDFQVTTPTGAIFQSTPNRDTPIAFAAHDPIDNFAYLVIPVTAAPAVYIVTPLNGATLGNVEVASGLAKHEGTADVSAGVMGSGNLLTLNYTLAPGQFQAGETVSFYQGVASDLPGAEPIAEDVTSSGSQTFTPESLGPATRYVFAVVSIDGTPRETFQVASFTATPYALPSGAVSVKDAIVSGAITRIRVWEVDFAKPTDVANWGVLTQADDGRVTYQEVPVANTSVTIPAGTAKTATISVRPIDKYGRSGPTYVCDTLKPGSCPST